jgi:hypothetical protein
MESIESTEEYRVRRKQMHDAMLSKQRVPYAIKRKMAETRIREFYNEAAARGYGVHVSVGGLDSITLACLIREMGYTPEEVPLVSASTLEDKSIQAVHKELGVITVKPLCSKVDILAQYGFPILSKEIANKIETLSKPTEKNKTVRHAIITGECGEQGHFAKNSRMRLSNKWLQLFGGLDEEGARLGYSAPVGFKVSDKCCFFLKEAPCDAWAKENHSVPYLGIMASEGGRRAKALEEHGCNYFGKTTIRSAPFSFFYHSDVVRLAVDLGVHIPEIYGDVVIDGETEIGEPCYKTTGEQRTGCSMCGFGIQLEKRPHRFDRLYARNPKEWEHWMYRCCVDENGNKYGWGRVLDYVGIEWRHPDHIEMSDGQLQGQKNIFDYL